MIRRVPSELSRRVRPLIPFVPAGGVVALWAALLPAYGGYFPRDWYPAALGTLGLLAVAMAGSGRVLPRGRPGATALAFLAALVAWNLLSIAWATSPGTAWEAANQVLMCVATGWIFALAPWTSRSAAAFCAAVAGVTAAVCGLALLAGTRAADLTDFFSDDRWAEPLGYPNGLAALCAVGALCAVVVSAWPGVAAPLQALALGAAALLTGLGLLPQSRGFILAGATAVVVLLALVPFRARLVARLAVIAVGLLLSAPPILDVYDAVAGERRVGPVLDDAAGAIALFAGLALLAGLLIAVLERRVQPGPAAVRATRVAGVAAAGLILIAGAGLAVAKADRIREVAADQWASLADPGEDQAASEEEEEEEDGEPDGSRLLSANPFQRYDYWRVSIRGWRDAPLHGLGAGNFEPLYTAERRFGKHSRYPHSVVLRVLAENGIVGALLFCGFLVAIGVGLLRGLRGAGGGARAATAAALAVAAYFGVHSQFDWIEEFPVIAGPALALLFVALAVREGDPPPAAPEARRAARSPAGMARAALVGAALLLAAVSVALPYLSLRYREQAGKLSATDRAAAYRDIDRAARLDPLAIDPYLDEGMIALRARDNRRARAAYERALEREPHWFPYLQLALIAAAEGDRRAALRQLDRAMGLSAQDPVLAAARMEILEGGRLDPVDFNRRLFQSPLFNVRRLS